MQRTAFEGAERRTNVCESLRSAKPTDSCRLGKSFSSRRSSFFCNFWRIKKNLIHSIRFFFCAPQGYIIHFVSGRCLVSCPVSRPRSESFFSSPVVYLFIKRYRDLIFLSQFDYAGDEPGKFRRIARVYIPRH